MKRWIHDRAKILALLAVNLAFVIAIVTVAVFYIRDYNHRLYLQNLRDIRNVNQAAAQIASELSAGHERKICNVLKYIDEHKMSHDELMAYIDSSNADNNVSFELLSKDFTGYVMKKDSTGNIQK